MKTENRHGDHVASCLCCISLHQENKTGCDTCGYGGGAYYKCLSGHFKTYADEGDWHNENLRGATCKDFDPR